APRLVRARGRGLLQELPGADEEEQHHGLGEEGEEDRWDRDRDVARRGAAGPVRECPAGDARERKAREREEGEERQRERHTHSLALRERRRKGRSYNRSK